MAIIVLLLGYEKKHCKIYPFKILESSDFKAFICKINRLKDFTLSKLARDVSEMVHPFLF